MITWLNKNFIIYYYLEWFIHNRWNELIFTDCNYQLLKNKTKKQVRWLADALVYNYGTWWFFVFEYELWPDNQNHVGGTYLHWRQGKELLKCFKRGIIFEKWAVTSVGICWSMINKT